MNSNVNVFVKPFDKRKKDNKICCKDRNTHIRKPNVTKIAAHRNVLRIRNNAKLKSKLKALTVT